MTREILACTMRCIRKSMPMNSALGTNWTLAIMMAVPPPLPKQKNTTAMQMAVLPAAIGAIKGNRLCQEIHTMLFPTRQVGGM